MSDPDLESVIEKVKKLLALAQSDNAHEASLAMARAQELIDRHRISETMLHGKSREEVEEGWPLWTSRTIDPWRGSLAVVLARANGCFVYKNTRSEEPFLAISGLPLDIEVTRYLFLYCMREIDRLADRESIGRGLAYKNSFKLGCVQGIGDEIDREKRELQQKMRAMAGVDGEKLTSALIVINNQFALSKEFITSRVKLHSRSGPRISDYGGLADGRRAGASIMPKNRSKVGGGAMRLE